MGNTFVGTFAAGQRVTASAIGESYSPDSNGRLLVEPQHLSITIGEPNKCFAMSSPDESFDTRLTSTGVHEISIGPCSAWGGEVTIKICAQ
jgi:hypothetical protein